MDGGDSTERLHTADDDPESRSSHSGAEKCCKLSPLSLVCVSHAFSAWGDRMWQFAVGLYLVELTPGSLRLTAVYQLVRTLAVILFGPFVGDWVDANPRLRVAQVSLFIQNTAVICCAIMLLLLLTLKDSLSLGVYDLLEALVIVIGSVAQLSSLGTTIAVERDWVVVMAGSDNDLLAGTNAILRRIDLSCKILAPVLVGQIMTYVSQVAGVVFIAGWNLLSVFLEYFLLLRVFKTVKCLSRKTFDTAQQEASHDSAQNSPEHSVDSEPQGSTELLDWTEEGNNDEATETLVPMPVIRAPAQRRPFPGLTRWKKRVVVLRKGWRLYMKQRVARPGLALACLYFTVLSFGAVATGYAYTQHLSESLLSILRGVGSLFGILATFVFPPMRNRLGLVRTGLFSMSMQFTCLLLCAAAVFAPGSPSFFLPNQASGGENTVSSRPILVSSCYMPSTRAHGSFQKLYDDNPKNLRRRAVLPPSIPALLRSNVSIPGANRSSTHTVTTPALPTVPLSTASASVTKTRAPPAHTSFVPSSTSTVRAPSFNCTVYSSAESPGAGSHFSYVSVGLLLAGIVVSRLGLWLSDLAITQLQQETIPEQERGIVGGMQSAFQSAMDLVMFALVIALPKPEHFGLLALLSVAAVGLGALLYASYAYRERGHLFHFDKVRRTFCVDASSAQAPRSTSQDDLDLDDEEEAMIQGVLSTRNENFSY